jgi:hypothetical protein
LNVNEYCQRLVNLRQNTRRGEQGDAFKQSKEREKVGNGKGNEGRDSNRTGRSGLPFTILHSDLTCRGIWRKKVQIGNEVPRVGMNEAITAVLENAGKDGSKEEPDS